MSKIPLVEIHDDNDEKDNSVHVPKVNSVSPTVASLPLVITNATSSASTPLTHKTSCWDSFTEFWKSCWAGCCVCFGKTEKALQPVLKLTEEVALATLKQLTADKINQTAVLNTEQKAAAIAAANQSIDSLGGAALNGMNTLADAAANHTLTAISAKSVIEATGGALIDASAPIAQAVVNISAADLKSKVADRINHINDGILTSAQKAAAIVAANHAIDNTSQGVLNSYGDIQKAIDSQTLSALNSAHVLTAMGANLKASGQILASTGLQISSEVLEQKTNAAISHTVSNTAIASQLSTVADTTIITASGVLGNALGVSSSGSHDDTVHLSGVTMHDEAATIHL